MYFCMLNGKKNSPSCLKNPSRHSSTIIMSLNASAFQNITWFPSKSTAKYCDRVANSLFHCFQTTACHCFNEHFQSNRSNLISVTNAFARNDCLISRRYNLLLLLLLFTHPALTSILFVFFVSLLTEIGKHLSAIKILCIKLYLDSWHSVSLPFSTYNHTLVYGSELFAKKSHANHLDIIIICVYDCVCVRVYSECSCAPPFNETFWNNLNHFQHRLM